MSERDAVSRRTARLRRVLRLTVMAVLLLSGCDGVRATQGRGRRVSPGALADAGSVAAAPVMASDRCAGCRGVRPNVRVWTKGNLEAIGELTGQGKARYHHVRIGAPLDPYDARFAFSIRIPGQSPLSSTNLSERAISQLADALGVVPSPAPSSMWPGDATRYAIRGFLFVYHEHALVVLDAVYAQLPGEDTVPEFGDAGMSTFYPLPLSEERLVQLFGEPDRVEDSFSW